MPIQGTKDYTDECMGSVPADLAKEGVGVFREAYCSSCLNMECTFAQGIHSRWRQRMTRQEDALFRPVFADIEDAQYAPIHMQKFLSFDADPDDWSVSGERVNPRQPDSEVSISASKLNAARILLQKALEDTVLPALQDTKIPPIPLPAPLLVRLDASKPPPPPSNLFPASMNTVVPAGGFLLEAPLQAVQPQQRSKILLTDDVDPWAPKLESDKGSRARVKKVVRASDGMQVPKK